jgi:hypothetical protein
LAATGEYYAGVVSSEVLRANSSPSGNGQKFANLVASNRACSELKFRAPEFKLDFWFESK